MKAGVRMSRHDLSGQHARKTSLTEAVTSTPRRLSIHSFPPRQTLLPVGPKVDTADAQVVARPDIARLELKGPAVRSYCFFTLVSIGQGGP